MLSNPGQRGGRWLARRYQEALEKLTKRVDLMIDSRVVVKNIQENIKKMLHFLNDEGACKKMDADLAQQEIDELKNKNKKNIVHLAAWKRACQGF